MWEKDTTKPAYYFAAWATESTAWGIHAIVQPLSTHTISQSVTSATIALNSSLDDLKHEFISTLTDEELNTTEPEWIEYATIEIMKRAS